MAEKLSVIMQSTFKKTRFAPTPSGFLHLGNLYCFVITHLLAKKSNAKVFLRIDDVDRERMEKEYLQDIFDTLHFVGLDWDEGPQSIEEFENYYSQMKRMHLYENALQTLKEKELVYACSCSRSQILEENADGIYSGKCRNKNIPLDAKDVCWRLKTDNNRKISMKILSGETIQTNLPLEMRDFIVRKKDGFPSYQLSSVIDDEHFGIDLIVRGEDLYHSSIAQLYLAAELGLQNFQEAIFYHHPLILGAEGKKLSKSAGDTSIRYLRKSKTQQEILNMIKLPEEFLRLQR
jgi:glutamyl-tRNA synthetase